MNDESDSRMVRLPVRNMRDEPAPQRAASVIQQAIEALEDITAGWKYIRSMHGDLYGVGWDRAQGKAEAALASLRAAQEGDLPPLPDDVVRYCPECGTIGPIPATAKACCPDSFGMSVRRWQAEKMERMLDRLRLALAAAGGGVPPGWKLVPVEPTAEMWAAVNKLDDEMAAGGYDGKGCTIEQAWECLLASSPQPEADFDPMAGYVPVKTKQTSYGPATAYVKAQPEAAPAVAQVPQSVEPEFYTVFAEHNGGWVPLPGYSNETVKGVKDLVLTAARKEGYRGTVDGRLLELGWRIAPVFAAAPEAPAQAAPSAGEVERALRRMLCVVACGRTAYMDDGEAQDNSVHPNIDFMRDTPAEIQRKLFDRSAALSHKEQP